MDNGYTKIPNDVLDAILTHGFNYTQLMIILYVLRKTAGWNKKKDSVSVSMVARKIGRRREYVSTLVRELEEAGVLKVSRPRNGVPPVVSVTSPKGWKPVKYIEHVKSIEHVNSTAQGLLNPVNTPVKYIEQVPVNSIAHTKDNIKDTYTKEKERKDSSPLEEEDELDLDGWEEP